MFSTLPTSATEALEWSPERYKPYFEDLSQRNLTGENIDQWLRDWSHVGKLASEVASRLAVGTTVDTTDAEAKRCYEYFVEHVMPMLRTMNNALNQKFLDSGLHPEGFEIPLQKIRAEVELFREENLPLFSEVSKLGLEYDEVIGAQTIEWQGKEITLSQIAPILMDQDRSTREKVWKTAMSRRMQDRETLNDLWVKFMDLRGKIAVNAGMPDFRAYQWKAMNRFDYTPEDAETFHHAIETVVVPAAKRIYDRRRERLGVDRLRPWDIGGEPGAAGPDPLGRPSLKPYESVDQLEQGLEQIFDCVDPQLGAYFKTMREGKLLDLENRKGKAPGGYCTDYALLQRPFIFMNAVGVHDDVQTLLHEGGHAFHAFESLKLPYIHFMDIPMEFCEVASMAMELIASPYLAKPSVGFYNEEQAARARVEHLESIIRFWPYMAVVDAFQHWVYTHHKDASDPTKCDAKWAELWDRFIVGIDYTGLEDVKTHGWHRKLHIFQVPFYYIEYGLAQLGAVQVWANSLTDQTKAVRQYREALALGGKKSLPDLFATAGAKFGFDVGTVSGAVELIEMTINELDPA